MIPEPITIDFETMPIQEGQLAPRPVGVSVFDPLHDKSPVYHHWGHNDYWSLRPLTGDAPPGVRLNHCTNDLLRDIWNSGRPLLFHHADFDLRVAHDHLGLEYPSSDRIHDTLWLAYLCDPNSQHLGLKELAAKELGIQPDERDIMAEWLNQNLFGSGFDYPHGRKPAAYTAFVPPEIAGPYANGDTTRTAALFKHLYPRMRDWGMMAAYERYQRTFRAFRRMEDRGVRVDVGKAEKSFQESGGEWVKAEHFVRRKLGRYGGPLAGKSFAAALEKSGMMDMGMWNRFRTPKTDQLSTAYDTLIRCIHPKHVALVRALEAGSRLKFAADTFLSFAQAPGGRLHPRWNVTRKHSGKSQRGSRTGRPSSEGPNVQNFTKGGSEVIPIHNRLKVTLPSTRACVIPEKGHRFIDADYSQQELRVLAFYEGGSLAEMYRANPHLDMHEYAGKEIYQLTGITLPRVVIKNTAFGIIYGSGAAKRAAQLGLDDRDSAVIKQMSATKKSYLEALPGVKMLLREWGYQTKYHVNPARMLRGPSVSRFARERVLPLEPVYTIGGRICFIEDPKVNDEGDIVQTYAYKLVNTAVQGSAADMLLEAIALIDEFMDEPITLTAHDQIVMSVPTKKAKKEAKMLSHLLEDVVPQGLTCPSALGEDGVFRQFDVPLIADTDIKKSWYEE